jgi:hypothetical protein
MAGPLWDARPIISPAPRVDYLEVVFPLGIEPMVLAFADWRIGSFAPETFGMTAVTRCGTHKCMIEPASRAGGGANPLQSSSASRGTAGLFTQCGDRPDQWGAPPLKLDVPPAWPVWLSL